METLKLLDQKLVDERKLYDSIFDLLGYEKIAFNGKSNSVKSGFDSFWIRCYKHVTTLHIICILLFNFYKLLARSHHEELHNIRTFYRNK